MTVAVVSATSNQLLRSHKPKRHVVKDSLTVPGETPRAVFFLQTQWSWHSSIHFTFCGEIFNVAIIDASFAFDKCALLGVKPVRAGFRAKLCWTTWEHEYVLSKCLCYLLCHICLHYFHMTSCASCLWSRATVPGYLSTELEQETSIQVTKACHSVDLVAKVLSLLTRICTGYGSIEVIVANTTRNSHRRIQKEGSSLPRRELTFKN